MDVSYLFWCSQENQKCETSEVKELKEKMKEMDEKLALIGLDFGGRHLDEAFKLLRKEKNPDPIPEVPCDVDDPKIAGELSRNKRSHQIGSNGTFDGEFELIINNTQSIFDGYEYFDSHGKGTVAEAIWPRKSYEYLKQTPDFS